MERENAVWIKEWAHTHTCNEDVITKGHGAEIASGNDGTELDNADAEEEKDFENTLLPLACQACWLSMLPSGIRTMEARRKERMEPCSVPILNPEYIWAGGTHDE